MIKNSIELTDFIKNITILGGAALAYFIGKDIGIEIYHLFWG